MEKRGLYKNISPLDHRYYQSNRKLFDALGKYLSEEGALGFCIRAEVALLKSHIKFQGLPAPPSEGLDALEREISPQEVYAEEEKTQHHIRALVNVLSRRLPEDLRPWVHMGATSMDILDTANALRIKEATLGVVLPELMKLERLLLALTQAEAETPQVGRTHGQHAVPITLGFALAEYVSRLGQSIQKIYFLTGELKGKLSGAVGSYNATSLIYRDPLALEKYYTELLGLPPAEYSNQILPPEDLLRLFLEYNTAFGIIANLADDLRHLQRSEIDEVREFFSQAQVGSSTMPQKRNPWNCEHVKSLWKAFAPRVMTFYMDQLSEHQRDLTNSSASRVQGEYISGLCASTARM